MGLTETDTVAPPADMVSVAFIVMITILGVSAAGMIALCIYQLFATYRGHTRVLPASRGHRISSRDRHFFGTMTQPSMHRRLITVHPNALSALAGRQCAFEGEECVCVICLDPVKTGTDARILRRCGHTYHAECIDEWLSNFRHGFS
jgi:hypothetical protein